MFFQKNILILLCFCIKIPKHLPLFCTILTPALEFVQEISPKMQFFLRFVCKYFCIFAVSFLLFPRENILFDLFCARFVILSGVISGGISTLLHARITNANIFAYRWIRSFHVREAFLSVLRRGRVCQDTFCGFSKLNDLSVKKPPKTSCLQMS